MPELPAPLPPAERTVGQLIAETIRAYGGNFWRALPLGLPLAVSTQLSLGHSANVQTVVLLRVRAARRRVLRLGLPPRARRAADADGVRLRGADLRAGAVPRSALVVLPGVAWLALFGLAVPGGDGRAPRLPRRARARAPARHRRLRARARLARRALIVVGVSELTLIALLRSQGENGQRVAHVARRTSSSARCSTSAAHCCMSTRQPG